MNETPIYRIIVDIDKGILQSIYGDLLPENVKVHFILRDHDNIGLGDPDPLDDLSPDFVPSKYYYW